MMLHQYKAGEQRASRGTDDVGQINARHGDADGFSHPRCAVAEDRENPAQQKRDDRTCEINCRRRQPLRARLLVISCATPATEM